MANVAQQQKARKRRHVLLKLLRKHASTREYISSKYNYDMSRKEGPVALEPDLTPDKARDDLALMASQGLVQRIDFMDNVWKTSSKRTLWRLTTKGESEADKPIR